MGEAKLSNGIPGVAFEGRTTGAVYVDDTGGGGVGVEEMVDWVAVRNDDGTGGAGAGAGAGDGLGTDAVETEAVANMGGRPRPTPAEGIRNSSAEKCGILYPGLAVEREMCPAEASGSPAELLFVGVWGALSPSAGSPCTAAPPPPLEFIFVG